MNPKRPLKVTENSQLNSTEQPNREDYYSPREDFYSPKGFGPDSQTDSPGQPSTNMDNSCSGPQDGSTGMDTPQQSTPELQGELPESIQIPNLIPTIGVPTKNLPQEEQRSRGFLSDLSLLIFAATVGLGLINLFNLIQSILDLERGRGEKRFPSFFIEAFLPFQQLVLGDFLIATRDLKVRDQTVQKDMLGEIVGIIDETQRNVIIQIFPLECYGFNEKQVHINAFIKVSEKQKMIIGGKENFRSE